MPCALRGASAMSWMMALCGSFGSTSPYAVPTSFSNWPTEPKLAPPKVGLSTRVMTMRVMRACAAVAAASKAQRTGIAPRRVMVVSFCG